MKTLSLTVGLILCLIGCNSIDQKATLLDDKYQLTIQSTGFEDSTKFYLYSSDLQKNLDSGYLVGGLLKLQGKVEFPQYVKLHTEFDPVNRGAYKKFRFWIENEPIVIEGNSDNFSSSNISGSPLSEMQFVISKRLLDLDSTRDSLLSEYRAHPDPNGFIISEIETFDSLRREVIFDFIRENPNNEVSIRKLALYKSDITLEELAEIFNRIDPGYYSYLHATEIINYIEGQLSQDNLATELDFSGKPDFSTID